MSNLMNESFTLPCGQVVKNRVCKAAMTERIAKGNNLAHQGHANLYDRWADGDMGILLTGNVQVDRKTLKVLQMLLLIRITIKINMMLLKHGQQQEQKIIRSYGCKFHMQEGKHQVKLILHP